MEEFTPGVEILERDAFPAISITGTSFSAILAQAVRGPDNLATLLSTFDNYKMRYGGYDGKYGHVAARAYFEQGGTGLYFIRVIGADAAVSAMRSEIAQGGAMGVSLTGVALPSGLPVILSVADTTPLGEIGDRLTLSILDVAAGGPVELNDADWSAVVTSATEVTLLGTDGDDFSGPWAAGGDLYHVLSTGKIETSSAGEWGNSTFLTTQKWGLNYDMTKQIEAGDTEIEMDSIVGMEVGDFAVLTQPPDDATCPRIIWPNFPFIVTALDTATNKVSGLIGAPPSESTITAILLSGALPVRVTCAAGHNFLTGSLARISGETGITPGVGINGLWTVDKISNTQFDLRGTLSTTYGGAMAGAPVCIGHIGVGAANTAYAKSSTTHKAKTALTSSYHPAQTQMNVASSALIPKGALLLTMFQSGGVWAYHEVRVTGVNGTILTVELVSSSLSTVAAPVDSVVVSTNFHLTHLVGGESTRYEHLSLESSNVEDGIETVLGQSEYLRWHDYGLTLPGGFPRIFAYPAPVDDMVMLQGLDGSAPTDADYTGTNSTKTYKHGIGLLDAIDVLPQFAIPGQSAVVQKAADTYCNSRKNCVFVGDVPLASDELAEVLEYRNVTLNVQSSYSTLTAPWLTEVDPDTPGGELTLPPSARALGIMSEVSRRRGTHKPPANEYLVGSVLDVNTRYERTEHGIMNANGVNVITNVSGRGIRLMGARTLWPVADRKQFLNVRRILNAVKYGLKDFGEAISFEASDELLWKNVERSGNQYLETLWGMGWFYPRKDPTKAFFFQCNEETNTTALRNAGKVRSIVGINPVLPGELIQFELMLWDGGASVTEL